MSFFDLFKPKSGAPKPPQLIIATDYEAGALSIAVDWRGSTPDDLTALEHMDAITLATVMGLAGAVLENQPKSPGKDLNREKNIPHQNMDASNSSLPITKRKSTISSSFAPSWRGVLKSSAEFPRGLPRSIRSWGHSNPRDTPGSVA